MEKVTLSERWFHWKRESKAKFALWALREPEEFANWVGDLIVNAFILTFIVGVMAGAALMALILYLLS